MIERLNEWRKQILRGISSQGLGGLGEDVARICFESQGYTVIKPSESKCGDLWIVDGNGVITQLEVKTSRKAKSGHWKFCLKKHYPNSSIDCSYADAVMLIQVSKINFYIAVIPSSVIGTRKNLSIRSPFPDAKSWISPYVQNLHDVSLPVCH